MKKYTVFCFVDQHIAGILCDGYSYPNHAIY